ncbi:PhzF family phenazine biosynthesis protein [Planctomicrobium piriforme]|uniref:Phenazine biosynthesis protein PhzF family n=1 Tax=Planctomicrobium piriforme TaxID=1576369 RepID=A0A1I3KDC6_9PLAN|nr:PhzF family phenazine biosynthesis protein [Planctomicrobium piriforme]SFI70384.1 phenazine biosynthesis protein PhzF family [Planctomicrobium piriforme]
MARVRCWQVDAFTDRPFSGNPAAVCWLDEPVPDDWMQAVAAEMNLSETAFVRPKGDQLGLRWFTPTVEVDLCGHATLATAHALWSNNLVSQERPLEFQTRSGVLTCKRDGELIELDFPALPSTGAIADTTILSALGLKQCAHFGRTRFDSLVVVDSPDIVRSLSPDFARLRAVNTRGVIVTALSDDPKFDFISRFFAPAVGVDEDPVCGSAHCCLAPYWGGVLGKSSLMAYQASARGGGLRLKVAGDRVKLGGQAVTVWQGELLC